MFDNLKTKLLNLKNINNNQIFIDNNWLDKYCELMNLNLNNIKQETTQLHHFIPTCYYKYYYKLKSKEALKLSNNDINNIKINLQYTDHILAHYYLCLCTKGNLKYKLANAFFHLTNKKYNYTNFNVESLYKYKSLYNYYIKRQKQIAYKMGKANLGNKYSADIKQKISLAKTGFKYSEAQKYNMSLTHKGINSKSIICIETQETFKSITEAELIFNITGIGRALKYKNKIAGGYHWAYLNDIETQQQLSNFIGKKPTLKLNSRKQKIKCIETDHIFESMSEAQRWLGKGYIRQQSGIYKAGGYHWEIIPREYNKDIIMDNSTSKNVCKIMCVETSIVYNSLVEAKKSISKGDIQSCLKKGLNYTAGGYHWIYYNGDVND